MWINDEVKKNKIVEKNTIFWRSFILSFFKKWERSYGDFLDGIKNISIMLCIFPPSFPPFFVGLDFFNPDVNPEYSFFKGEKNGGKLKKRKGGKKRSHNSYF